MAGLQLTTVSQNGFNQAFLTPVHPLHSKGTRSKEPHLAGRDAFGRS